MKYTEVLNEMEKELTIRNYSRRTIENYRSAVRQFSKWVAAKGVPKISGSVLTGYFHYLKSVSTR